MRTALDHSKKAAALAKEEAVLPALPTGRSGPWTSHSPSSPALPRYPCQSRCQQAQARRPQPGRQLSEAALVETPHQQHRQPLQRHPHHPRRSRHLHDDHSTFAILMLMVVLSVSLRFIQEHKSANKVYALKSLIDTSCLVLGRDSDHEQKPVKIDRSQLVVGDVIRVATGSVVPADCIVIAPRCSLSPELLDRRRPAVEKYALGTSSATNLSSANSLDCPPGTEVPCSAKGTSATMDQPNLLFMGTHVVSGHADALVVATGDRTYVGTVACVSDDSQVQNDFQRGIRTSRCFCWLSCWSWLPPCSSSTALSPRTGKTPPSSAFPSPLGSFQRCCPWSLPPTSLVAPSSLQRKRPLSRS